MSFHLQWLSFCRAIKTLAYARTGRTSHGCVWHRRLACDPTAETAVPHGPTAETAVPHSTRVGLARLWVYATVKRLGPRPGFGLGLAGSVAASMALMLVGCSPGARDQIKRFFFEVPGPTSLADDRRPSQRVADTLPSVSAGRRFVSVHPPFVRRQCTECHDSRRGQSLIQPWADRCASCHENALRPRPHLHGPFGSRSCNECHLPHASALPALLRQREPDLCLACHEPTLSQDDSHHRDLAGACTRCHDPHAGPDRRLLRPIDDWQQLAPDYEPESRSPTGGSGP